MNAEQKKIVTDMQTGLLPPVHVIPADDARVILEAGLARRATISPDPGAEYQAINLTAQGRGFQVKGRKAPAPDTPAE